VFVLKMDVKLLPTNQLTQEVKVKI